MAGAIRLRQHAAPAPTRAHAADQSLVARQHRLRQVFVGAHRLPADRAWRSADRLKFHPMPVLVHQAQRRHLAAQQRPRFFGDRVQHLLKFEPRRNLAADLVERFQLARALGDALFETFIQLDQFLARRTQADAHGLEGLRQTPHLFWTFGLDRRFEVVSSQTVCRARQLTQGRQRRAARNPHARAQQNQRAEKEANLNDAQAIHF